MIIGHGLLAKAFEDRFATDPRVCIFASGVSNSQCTDPTVFERESILAHPHRQYSYPIGAFSILIIAIGLELFIRHGLRSNKRNE